MNAYRRILVPTDGTALSMRAAREAATLAKDLNATIAAVYVKAIVFPGEPAVTLDGGVVSAPEPSEAGTTVVCADCAVWPLFRGHTSKKCQIAVGNPRGWFKKIWWEAVVYIAYEVCARQRQTLGKRDGNQGHLGKTAV